MMCASSHRAGSCEQRRDHRTPNLCERMPARGRACMTLHICTRRTCNADTIRISTDIFARERHVYRIPLIVLEVRRTQLQQGKRDGVGLAQLQRQPAWKEPESTNSNTYVYTCAGASKVGPQKDESNQTSSAVKQGHVLVCHICLF